LKRAPPPPAKTRNIDEVHMSRFRITPARRDFLRLFFNNPVLVKRTRKRFVHYWANGQISFKMSSKTFDKFLEHEYIEIDHILFDPKSESNPYILTPLGAEAAALDQIIERSVVQNG
jgi:hypothetical protein